MKEQTKQFDDGGPAYPGQVYAKGGDPAYPHTQERVFDRGMTLRDHFAAMAMQGMVAAVYGIGTFAKSSDEKVDVSFAPDFASNAYVFADAMLAARKVKA